MILQLKLLYKNWLKVGWWWFGVVAENKEEGGEVVCGDFCVVKVASS